MRRTDERKAESSVPDARCIFVTIGDNARARMTAHEPAPRSHPETEIERSRARAGSRSPLRVMIYDRTCRGSGPLLGLTHTWWAGAHLYKLLDRFDASYGAASWTEALEWLAHVSPSQPIQEIQFWGHGKWGCAMIDREPLDRAALEPSDRRHPLLDRIRARLIPDRRALWWFRTCETFGMKAGHEFARAFCRFFDCRVAGHTYVIWLAQSGLHTIDPDRDPDWPIEEGLPPEARGSDALPERALWSSFFAPNTISCFRGTIPAGF